MSKWWWQGKFRMTRSKLPEALPHPGLAAGWSGRDCRQMGGCEAAWMRYAMGDAWEVLQETETPSPDQRGGAGAGGSAGSWVAPLALALAHRVCLWLNTPCVALHQGGGKWRGRREERRGRQKQIKRMAGLGSRNQILSLVE